MSRTKAIHLAALLAPLCAVALARLVLQAGPAAAGAARGEVSPVTDVAGSAAATPTGEQAAALAWMQTQTLDSSTPSPMARPPKVDPQPEPAAPPPARAHPTAGLVVSVIIGDGESGVAKINGRLYQIGDEVVSGWFITDLRPRQQEVELADTSGEVVTLSRSRP